MVRHQPGCQAREVGGAAGEEEGQEALNLMQRKASSHPHARQPHHHCLPLPLPWAMPCRWLVDFMEVKPHPSTSRD